MHRIYAYQPPNHEVFERDSLRSNCLLVAGAENKAAQNNKVFDSGCAARIEESLAILQGVMTHENQNGEYAAKRLERVYHNVMDRQRCSSVLKFR